MFPHLQTEEYAADRLRERRAAAAAYRTARIARRNGPAECGGPRRAALATMPAATGPTGRTAAPQSELQAQPPAAAVAATRAGGRTSPTAWVPAA